VAKPVAKPTVKPVAKPVAKSAIAAPAAVKTTPKPVEVVTKQSYKKPAPSAIEIKDPVVETGNTKRYSDVELEEFRQIINQKLSISREELNNLMDQMQNPGINAGDDSDNSYKTLEDGSSTADKEQLGQLAARLRKFIENLENAMVRIENKTYGICKVTGKLISKERLRAVPHTTLSMEAKMQQYK
jgi:RNA polymerase-binding transcription factor DksA